MKISLSWTWGVLLLTGVAIGIVAGCTRPADKTAEEHQAGPVMKAVAMLSPTVGQKAGGMVTFLKEGEGIRIVAEIHGLAPGAHGFHIHQYGDCSAPDATSAGAHFNPTGEPHGGPDAEKRHAGDLGNVEAGQDGNAMINRLDSRIVLDGDQSILGRSVIVHAQPDDFRTQPTGGAGARIACGVIGAARK